MWTKILTTLSLFLAPLAAITAAAVPILGQHPFTESGDPYPGTPTAIAYSTTSAVTWTTGALILGGIILVAITSSPMRNGWLTASTYLVQRAIASLAALWLIGSLLMLPLSVATASGIPATRLLHTNALGDILSAVEESYGWLVSAICALIILITNGPRARWNPTVMSTIPAFIGVMAVPVTGNVAQGPNHDIATTLSFGVYATLAAILGLKVLTTLREHSNDTDTTIATSRIALASLIAELTCLTFGAILILWFLAPGSMLITTTYGRICLAAAIALIILAIKDAATVRTTTTGTTPWSRTIDHTGATILALAAAAAHYYTAPALLGHQFTIWDVFLGYPLPHPPNALRLITTFRFDFFLGTASIVIAGLYIWGFTHVRRQGIEWPTSRLVWWLTGCASLLMGTSAGLQAYSAAMMSVHMGNHMMLNMYAPVMLVLGSPLTLMLRALPTSPRGVTLTSPRQWTTSLIHSGFSRVVTHPAFTFIMFVASLYIVYFTPLWGEFAKYHWWHLFISIHFTISGYLFFWTIIGDDPGPRRMPHIARLGLLLGAMPFHAFFGIAMMTLDNVIAEKFYGQLSIDWLHNRLTDQRLAGAVAWGLSEVPILIVAIALGVQWYRSDQKEAKRMDRWGDEGKTDELDAYNQMLQNIHAQRSPSVPTPLDTASTPPTTNNKSDNNTGGKISHDSDN
ncbi:cytochrome c oxidase assembly protein [Corynebacterium kroppenstedtii]|uniref:cytochrome c oxidase assembly protein n=1 Tax=Corynebacterium sp. PCR 32 TaxID=3351342 RepID=UPI0030B27A8A